MADNADILLSKISQDIDQGNRAVVDKLDMLLDTMRNSGGTTAKQAKRDHSTLVRVQGTLDKLLKETETLVRTVRGSGGGRGSGGTGGGLGGGNGPNNWTINQMTVRNAVFQNVQGLGGGGGGTNNNQPNATPNAPNNAAGLAAWKDAAYIFAGAVGLVLKQMFAQYIEGYIKQQQTGVTQFWNAILPKTLGGMGGQLGGKTLQDISTQFKQTALAAGSFTEFANILDQTMTAKLKKSVGLDLKLAGEVAAQTQETIRLIAGRNLSDAELISETNKLTNKFADLRHLSTLQVKELSELVNGMSKNWQIMSGLSERQRRAVIDQTMELYKNKDMLGLSAQRLKEFAEAAALARKDSAQSRIQNAARLAQAAILSGRGDLVGDLMKGAITGKQNVDTMRQLGGAIQGMQQEALDQAEQGNVSMLAFYNNIETNVLEPMSDSLKRQLDIAKEAESVAAGLRPQATIASLEAERDARGKVASALDSAADKIQEWTQKIKEATNGVIDLAGILTTVKHVLIALIGLRVLQNHGISGTIGGAIGRGIGGAASGAATAGAAATLAKLSGVGAAGIGGYMLGSAAYDNNFLGVQDGAGWVANKIGKLITGRDIEKEAADALKPTTLRDRQEKKITEQKTKTEEKQADTINKVAQNSDAQVSVAQQQLNELKKMTQMGSTQTERLTELVTSIEELKTLQSEGREKIRPVKSHRG